jgi:tetratricopeptide (TPR) repeat protein
MMEKKWRVLVLLLAVAALVISGCANKWVTAGKIAMGQKNWEKAIDDFGKALEQNPKNGEAQFLMARCYSELGDFGSMISHLDAADTLYEKGKSRIRELRIDAWEKLFNSGIKDANEENFEQADGDFGLAISILPDRYEAYTNKAFVLERMNQHDSAFYYYGEAYKIDPGNIKILENYASLSFNLGVSAYKLADSLGSEGDSAKAAGQRSEGNRYFMKADSLYAQILVQDQKHAEALMRRGDIAREKGDYETAIGFYNRAVEVEPSSCDIWFNIGVLYFQNLKNNEEALKAFSRAKEICPDDINVQVNIGVVLLTMGDVDEAVAHLESFTRDFPDECIGWDLYSQALLRKGNRQEANEANDKYEECKSSKQ